MTSASSSGTAAVKYQNVMAGLTCPMIGAEQRQVVVDVRAVAIPVHERADSESVALCGTPHKRHYADGGVMRPVWLFGLVGALLVVILSA